ncbi:hypothetical protein ACUXST_001693 [Sphingomonas sp. F9_3S_D5_B_2]
MRDGVWAHGEYTEFEAWIAGESRKIAVTRQAIDTYLSLTPDQSAVVTAEQRCAFVRDNLALVIAAANRKIDPSDPAADTVTIRGSDL